MRTCIVIAIVSLRPVEALLSAGVSDASFGLDLANTAGSSSEQELDGRAFGLGGEDGVGMAIDKPFAQLRLSDGLPAGGVSALGAKSDGSGGFILVPLPTPPANQGVIAWGSFKDSLPELGWSSLAIHTAAGGEGSDGTKMYAAGAIEGYLTAQRMREFSHNSRALTEMSDENRASMSALRKALADLIAKMTGPEKSFDFQGGTAFEVQAHLALLQTWGLRDGYQLALGSTGEQPLSMVDMFIMNSDGVIDELLSEYHTESDSSLLQRKHRARRRRLLSTADRKSRRVSPGHCTGLVRLTEDRSELYFGHTTWEGFSEMTRIWKVYDFPLQGVSASKISFSSYPGCVSSTDDYYLMDSGLAITETTLGIPRKQKHKPMAATPDFLRIMAANRLSSNGEDWVRSMTDSATGTYSSQWLVLDYKRFSPGADALQGGTFYVLEQAPGISHYEDMTSWLQKEGYWASFDRAFFDDIRTSTGDDAMVRLSQERSHEAQAEIFSKDRTPRAQIARQTAGGLNSLAAMREEMTRNKGTQEPVDQPTLRNPRYAISARDDLKDREHKDQDGSPEGGVDSKITSSCLFQNLMAEAISSPSHVDMPVFRWTGDDGAEEWPGFPHEGLPNVANFDWVWAGPQGAGTGSEEAAPVQRFSGDGPCH